MHIDNRKPAILKSMQLLHRAMLFGQILFAAIVFFLNYSENFQPTVKGDDQLLQVISVLLSFGGFYIGKYIIQKKILQARECEINLIAKVNLFRSASILQWALLEGPSLFSSICFLLTGNYAFLALAATLILIFTIIGPNKLKIGMLLHLNQEELEHL